MFFLRLTLVGLLWLGGAFVSRAATWHVTTNGAGLFNGTDWANAFSNIQDGINAAGASGTVLVSNGVYETGGTLVGNYVGNQFKDINLLTNRVVITNAVTVQSANNDPTNTIIKGARATDGNTNGWGAGAVRGVYMSGAGAKLIGFTITNCATLTTSESTNTGDRMCGAIYCPWPVSSMVISNCIVAGNVSRGSYTINWGSVWNSQILNNTVGGEGGGFGGGYIYNSIISGNRALGPGWAPGGGLSSICYASNCLVISNTSAGNGGGIYVGAHTIERCTFIGNTGNHGGGMFGEAKARFKNCLIAGNKATGSGGGVYNKGTNYNCTIVGNSASGSGGGINGGTAYNCISWGNDKDDSGVAAYYSCGNGALYTDTALGNTTNNPLFVNAGSGTGTGHIMGDYHLQANSPCVNTGTNQLDWTGAVDLDGRARIRYGTVDMGCYEFIYRGTIFTVSSCLVPYP